MFYSILLTSSLSEPSVPCCDICNPELLNRTRPARLEPVKRKAQIKFGLANTNVEDALHEWRKRVWTQDFKNSMFGPTGILTNETLTALSSVGPILSLKQLESIVGENWPWFGKYGDNLLTELISLNIPPMIPKPPQSRRTKRSGMSETTVGQGGGGKRQRALPQGSESTTLTAPTPVSRFVNAPSSTIPTLPQQFYPYPSTPLRPLAPPFSATGIYPNPYYAYMTPVPPTMSYHPAYTHPPTNSSSPLPTSANSQATQTSQQTTLFDFRHYNPESGGSSRYNQS